MRMVRPQHPYSGRDSSATAPLVRFHDLHLIAIHGGLRFQIPKREGLWKRWSEVTLAAWSSPCRGYVTPHFPEETRHGWK